MMKKITAGMISLMMIFASGVLQAANVLPETAVCASAEKTIDEIMEEPKVVLTFTNYKGAMYTVNGKLIKNATHETQGFFDWKFRFEIDGKELTKALDGDFTKVVDSYDFIAKGLTDEYKFIDFPTAMVTGEAYYESGESKPYYFHGPVVDPIPYSPISLAVRHHNDGRFEGLFKYVDRMNSSVFDPEGLDLLVTELWINTSDIDLTYEHKPQWVTGDANNDGVIDIEDVALIMNHINGVKPLGMSATISADYDYNNVVDINDVVGILNRINGIGRS